MRTEVKGKVVARRIMEEPLELAVGLAADLTADDLTMDSASSLQAA